MKGFAALLALVFGLLAFGIIGSIWWYYVYPNNLKKAKPVRQEIHVKVGTPAKVEPLGNGKFRASSKYCGVSFEFSQPSPGGQTWKVSDYPVDEKQGIFQFNAILREPSAGGSVFGISCRNNTEKLTLDEFYARFEQIERDGLDIVSKTPATLGGVPAYKVYLYGSNTQSSAVVYIMVRNNKRYGLSIPVTADTDPRYLVTANAILGSLTFQK